MDGEDRFAGPPIRSVLRNLSIAVQVLDPDLVERIQQVLPHHNERRVANPGVVRDEADDASASLVSDLPLRNAEEADVEIVQVELFDAPV